MARKRKTISKLTRFEIFKRDGFACQYCGRTPPAVILQIDHITPHSKGGSDDALNLLTACQDCNLGKTNRDLASVPPPLKAQMEEQRERREQVEQYNSFLVSLRNRQDEDIKELGRFWYEGIGLKGYIFGPGRTPSIRTFLKHITKVKIMDAMEQAIARFAVYNGRDDQNFRYFCGICWRIIRGPTDG